MIGDTNEQGQRAPAPVVLVKGPISMLVVTRGPSRSEFWLARLVSQSRRPCPPRGWGGSW